MFEDLIGLPDPVGSSDSGFMKLYAVVTPSHQALYERFFVPSLDTSAFELNACLLEQDGADEFLACTTQPALSFDHVNQKISLLAQLQNFERWHPLKKQLYVLQQPPGAVQRKFSK